MPKFQGFKSNWLLQVSWSAVCEFKVNLCTKEFACGSESTDSCYLDCGGLHVNVKSKEVKTNLSEISNV